jgi:hypothetical protein
VWVVISIVFVWEVQEATTAFRVQVKPWNFVTVFRNGNFALWVLVGETTSLSSLTSPGGPRPASKEMPVSTMQLVISVLKDLISSV